MKIAIDIRHLAAPNRSGVGVYMFELVKHLAAACPKDSFLLCVSGKKHTLNHVPALSLPNIQIIKKQIPNRLVTTILLSKAATIESIFCISPDLWLFPNLNSIHTRIPYAITAHDVSFHLMPEMFPAKTRLWQNLIRPTHLFQHAQTILAVSKATKQDLSEIYHVDPTRIHVTPLGVSAAFHPGASPEDQAALHNYGINRPYFLTLSTLEPRKNLTSVVEAYTDWRRRIQAHQAPRLVLAGGRGWKTQQLFNAIQACPYKDDIVLTGYVEEKHKPALLRHADLLLFPSFYEGFGLPPLEAMASGTPVIASAAGSLPEVLGQAGLLVNPHNVADISQAIEALVMLKNGRRTFAPAWHILKNRGLKHARQFSWQKTAQTTRQILDKVF